MNVYTNGYRGPMPASTTAYIHITPGEIRIELRVPLDPTDLTEHFLQVKGEPPGEEPFRYSTTIAANAPVRGDGGVKLFCPQSKVVLVSWDGGMILKQDVSSAGSAPTISIAWEVAAVAV